MKAKFEGGGGERGDMKFSSFLKEGTENLVTFVGGDSSFL